MNQTLSHLSRSLLFCRFQIGITNQLFNINTISKNMQNLSTLESIEICGGTEGYYIPEPGSYDFPVLIADIPSRLIFSGGGGSNGREIYPL